MVSYSDAILEAPAYFYFRPLQAAKPPRQTVRIRAAEIAPSDLHQVLGSRPSEATRRSEESAWVPGSPATDRSEAARTRSHSWQTPKGCVVRAAGLEPAQAFRPYGFSYPLRLSPPPFGVWGLDYPFTLARARLRCCPSSLYTFRRAMWVPEAWLGIATWRGFPDFGQFYSPGFPGCTQLLKSVASTSFATPALGRKSNDRPGWRQA